MKKKAYIPSLIIVVLLLAAFYVFRFLYAPLVLDMLANNETFVSILGFIYNTEWLHLICVFVISFVLLYFYCCASCGKLHLKWYETIILVGAMVGMYFLNKYYPGIANIISTPMLLLLPMAFRGKLFNTSITFTACALVKTFSLGYSLGNVPLIALELFLWLLVAFVVFNFKREN